MVASQGTGRLNEPMKTQDEAKVQRDPRPVRRSSNSGGARAALMLLAVVLVGGLAAWPWLQPRLGGLSGAWTTGMNDRLPAPAGGAQIPPLAERIEMLEASLGPLATRLDYIERRLAQLETDSLKMASEPRKDAGARPGGADQAQIARLAEDVAAFKIELGAVRKLSAEDGGAARLSSAVEKAEAAFRRFAERRDRAPLFLAALGQLREAVERGSPYQVELHAAVVLADKDAVARLAVLGSAAAAGVVTRTGLVDGFRLAAAAARRLDGSANADWLPVALRGWLASAISIRRGDGSETSVEGALARAAKLLASGDLAGAVGVVKTIEGSAALTLAPWLEAAKSRLSVDAALSELSAAAIAAASGDE